MARPKKNDYFNGNKGELWVNGKKVMTAMKVSSKKKIKYEEFPSPSGDGMERVKVGHEIEISVSFKSTSDDDADKFDAFNESEDIEIIASDSNISGTAKKRAKFIGVTFDEEPLINWEKNKLGEIELSGKASDHEWLQK